MAMLPVKFLFTNHKQRYNKLSGQFVLCGSSFISSSSFVDISFIHGSQTCFKQPFSYCQGWLVNTCLTDLMANLIPRVFSACKMPAREDLGKQWILRPQISRSTNSKPSTNEFITSLLLTGMHDCVVTSFCLMSTYTFAMDSINTWGLIKLQLSIVSGRCYIITLFRGINCDMFLSNWNLEHTMFFQFDIWVIY